MGYVGNAPAEKYTTIDKQTLTGNSTVGPYTLTHSVGNEQEIEVFVNNVRQEPSVSYTVSSNQLTMSASVASADDFYVIFQGKAKMTATHPPTFDLTAANGTFTGTVTTGGLTVGSDTAKTKFYSDSTYNGIYNGSALTNNESIYMGSGTLFFYSGGGERMRIDSSGRVGIGTTSPSASLAAGGLHVTDRIAVGSGSVGTPALHPDTDTDTGLFFGTGVIGFGTGGNERMRIDASGNVGIGTTSSATPLTVQSDSNTLSLRLLGRSGDDRSDLEFYENDNTTKIGTISGETDSLNIVVSSASGVLSTTANTTRFRNVIGTEAMRIDSSGNVLVGTTDNNVGDNSGASNGGINIGTAGVKGVISAAAGQTVAYLNRLGSDGDIIDFRKDGTTVGSIGVDYSTRMYIGTGGTGLFFNDVSKDIQPISTTAGLVDDTIDLGSSASRFRDLNLSGGIFLGGTGSANKLDDYEEGTWTPAPGSGTWTVNQADYTKIGRLVVCTFFVTATSTVGPADFTGLPFTPNKEAAGIVGYQNSTSGVMSAYIQAANVWNFRQGSTQFGLANNTTARGTLTYTTDA